VGEAAKSGGGEAEARRYHIVVSGRVQGVGYRYFTRDVAESLGLTGWVQNLTDGDVELEAFGEKGAIDALIGRLREGPPLAKVTGVEVCPMAAGPAGGGFFIKR